MNTRKLMCVLAGTLAAGGPQPDVATGDMAEVSSQPSASSRLADSALQEEARGGRARNFCRHGAKASADADRRCDH